MNSRLIPGATAMLAACVLLFDQSASAQRGDKDGGRRGGGDRSRSGASFRGDSGSSFRGSSSPRIGQSGYRSSGSGRSSISNRDLERVVRSSSRDRDSNFRPASWSSDLRVGNDRTRSAASYYRHRDNDRWDNDRYRDRWRHRYRRDWDDDDDYYFSINIGGGYPYYGSYYRSYPYYRSVYRAPYYGYGYASPYAYYGYPYSPFSGYSYYTGYSSYYTPGYYW